ncbi:MAG: papain-like cysteine protease family protein [Hyphomicrobiaceae bacterium]
MRESTNRGIHRFARRQFIGGGLAAVCAGSGFGPAVAGTTCGAYPSAPGAEVCESAVNMVMSIAKAESQHQSQWCWAASTSMIFRYHGYNIPQEQIVLEGMEAWRIDRLKPVGE